MSRKHHGNHLISSKYAWQETVRDALRASPSALPAKLNAAQKAIVARLDDGELGLNERTAIKDTLTVLRMLSSEVRAKTPGREPRDKALRKCRHERRVCAKGLLLVFPGG